MFDKKTKNYHKTKSGSYLTGVISCLIFLSGFLLWQKAEAACVSSGANTWATTPDDDSINTCISGATSGDTINVSTGDGSETWDTAVSITKPVKLVGPGRDNLTIKWTPEVGIAITNVDDWEISGFTFDRTEYVTSNASADALMLVRGSTGWRFYDNKFVGVAGSAQLALRLSIYNAHDMTGLISNNTFETGRIYVVNTAGSNESVWAPYWYRDASLGADGSGDAVYIEDNIFVTPVHSGNFNHLDSKCGARWVFRYNTVIDSYIMAHGAQDSCRGTRTWEIYGNTFSRVNDDQVTFIPGISLRSGTGVIYDNLFTNKIKSLRFYNDRSAQSYSNSDNTTGAGLCDGDHRYDGNLNPNPASGHIDGYPCRDQIGRGKDASLWSDIGTNTSSIGPAQELVPVYIWALRKNTGAIGDMDLAPDTNVNYDSSVTGLDAVHIVANRDYYFYNESFDGTSGTGCGTLANRPTTCTTGVGYWATNQSCSDLSTLVGDIATNATRSTISGTLYKCTATNTWTEYYTPYTYPHPLRSSDDIVAPAAPSGLSVN